MKEEKKARKKIVAPIAKSALKAIQKEIREWKDEVFTHCKDHVYGEDVELDSDWIEEVVHKMSGLEKARDILRIKLGYETPEYPDEE